MNSFTLRTACALTAFAVAGLAVPASSGAEWAFQVGTGSAYSFPSRLEIEQEGQPDITLDAEYETRAWGTMAPYYNIRIGKWKGDRAWEFETLHHKLHLSNRPEEVQKFNISHGYNINTVNRAFRTGGMILRAGLGVVITHPESEVRGLAKEDDGGINGFYLSGVAFQAGAEKRLALGRGFFLSVEGKATAAYAEVPVAGGSASVPNYALHGLIGIGYLYGD